MRQPLIKLIGDRRGATAIEYGLILALVALGVLGGMTAMADRTVGMLDRVSSTVLAADEG